MCPLVSNIRPKSLYDHLTDFLALALALYENQGWFRDVIRGRPHPDIYPPVGSARSHLYLEPRALKELSC